MPLWLQIAAGVLGAVGMLAVFVRRDNDRLLNLIRAEVGRAFAEHAAACPARGRAFADPDDSGSVPSAISREPSWRYPVSPKNH